MVKLVSLRELELISKRIKKVDNQRGEFLRKIHYGCYLLCSQAGLRISEAVKFDLNSKNKQGLYQINKPKKQPKRLVYVPEKVIKELRKNNWKPNQTNRFNFYHFLRRIKRKLGISKNVELTPHTLRRSFTTYHAENGLPLPLLQKLLGHSSIRTTALYWRDIYGESDADDILSGKQWLERPKKPPLPKDLVPPVERNFSENLESVQKLVIKPNLPPIEVREKPVIVNPKPAKEQGTLTFFKGKENFPPLTIEKESKAPEINEQLPAVENARPIIMGSGITKKEQILLGKIKQLKEQLAQVQAENKQLKTDKEQAEALVQVEKERADQAEVKLKIIGKGLYQWAKINYYKKLEKEQKAQIEQPPKPPPWRK